MFFLFCYRCREGEWRADGKTEYAPIVEYRVVVDQMWRTFYRNGLGGGRGSGEAHIGINGIQKVRNNAGVAKYISLKSLA